MRRRVRSEVWRQTEDPLGDIDEWALEFDHLNTEIRDNLKYPVIEQCCSLTKSRSGMLEIKPEMYAQWDTSRKTYGSILVN